MPRVSRSRPRPATWWVAGAIVLVAVAAGFALLLGAGVFGRRATQGGGTAAARPPLQLWLYYVANLADEDALAKLVPVWRRAHAAGYRHVVLGDVKFSRLGEMDEEYFATVARVRALADTLGLEIVPMVFPMGRSNSLLALNPNLAEGLPVRDALFEARGGFARLVPDPPVSLERPPDAVDFGVHVHDGIARIARNLRRARFRYRVPVSPHRAYHVSVAIRTEGFSGTPLVRVLGGGRPLLFVRSLGVERDQGWTTHHVLFNSFGNHEVDVYFGVWRRTRGVVEWKDWRIEEEGPTQILRRPSLPLELSSHVLEGRDLDRVEDPLLGRVPWRGQFDDWHPSPPIRTGLADGTRFRMSWHHVANVYNGQVVCCLSDSGAMAAIEDEAHRIRAAWGAGAYLMSYDEIRALGQDATCLARGATPGRILADHVRRATGFLAGARAYVWNDMFDPHQNAVKDFYLVNGDLAGSWEGLDPGVTVVNWNHGAPEASLRFFADRGHEQVIAGYYDGRPEDVRGWLEASRGIPRVTGVMYTTWQGRFDDLEAFADAVRAGWK